MATIPYDIHALDDPDYPASDGKPMADNTEQFRWIVAVQGGLDSMFRDRPDVLVVGDLLWYPVEGNNKIRTAPDAMVIFGRPKGPRGSYIQYREEGIAPQVVFEILSPGNRRAEMTRKLDFYERYGVEEYYILNPDRDRHRGYTRDAEGKLALIPRLLGWVSPLLSVRFEMSRELRILKPSGQPFETYLEVDANRDIAVQQTVEANLRAERAERQAEVERREKLQERREKLQERREKLQEREAKELSEGKLELLRAQLRALGFEPDN